MTAAGPRRRAAKGRPGTSGFTLIELLIALTLFGLLSIALAGGLRFGTRVWERGHEQSSAFSEIEAVHGFLRQQLEQARLSTLASDAGDADLEFAGSHDSIEFLAPLSRYVGTGGIYRFRLTGTFDGGTGRLILSWVLFRPDQRQEADDGEVSRRVLLEGIDALTLRYYGALEPESDPEWHEAWDAGPGLPGLISIDLEFPAGDLRVWPTLVVAPIAARAEFER